MAKHLSVSRSVISKAENPAHPVPTDSLGALDIATKDSTITVCLTTLEDVTSTAERMTIKAMQAWERLLGSATPIAESLESIRTTEQLWKQQI